MNDGGVATFKQRLLSRGFFTVKCVSRLRIDSERHLFIIFGGENEPISPGVHALYPSTGNIYLIISEHGTLR
jgi:hypothetical protein